MPRPGYAMLMVLTVVTLTAGASEDFTSFLHRQRAAGLLSSQEELVLKVLAMANPAALPEPYRSLPRPPGKCGTMTLWEVRLEWPRFTDLQRETLAPYVTRPSLPLWLISPSGRFKVHYTTSGIHQTTESFAREAALAFDQAYEVEVVQMGYPAPPPDNGMDGAEYDVYIQNIADYGWTYPESPVPETPASDWTTYIIVDNDYARGFYSKGVDGLRVTAAHEFFHAIHFGIREPQREPAATADLFYYEVSSTWMEDVVYDEVNDYYNYLNGFFQWPDLPFNTADGWREYGMAVWNHFVAKRVGTEAIRESWLNMRTTHGMFAIRQALLVRGLTFEDALAEFAVWNMFTGSRADTVTFYPEGKHYPAIRLQREDVFTERIEVPDSCKRLATKFYSFVPQLPAPYNAQLVSAEASKWRLSVAVLGTGRAIFDYVPGATASFLGYLTPVDTVVLAVSRTHLGDESGGGDANGFYRFATIVEPGSVSGRPPKGNTIVAVSANPFRMSQEGFLTVLIHSESDQEVTMSVRDMHGRRVLEQWLGTLPAGRVYPWVWDGRNDRGAIVASGVYLIVARFASDVAVEKVAVLR
ncbi:MAG: MXAN_6640 family putative metalloprotease [Candidatus Oleimicrobiaceae bacterium]